MGQQLSEKVNVETGFGQAVSSQPNKRRRRNINAENWYQSLRKKEDFQTTVARSKREADPSGRGSRSGRGTTEPTRKRRHVLDPQVDSDTSNMEDKLIAVNDKKIMYSTEFHRNKRDVLGESVAAQNSGLSEDNSEGGEVSKGKKGGRRSGKNSENGEEDESRGGKGRREKGERAEKGEKIGKERNKEGKNGGRENSTTESTLTHRKKRDLPIIRSASLNSRNVKQNSTTTGFRKKRFANDQSVDELRQTVKRLIDAAQSLAEGVRQVFKDPNENNAGVSEDVESVNF